MKNSISLSEEHIIAIEFLLEGNSFHGNMILSPGKFPSVEVMTNDFIYEYNDKSFDKLVCHSGSRLIILYECCCSFNFIYPQFITFDFPEDAIYDSFELNIDGMNSIVNKSSCMSTMGGDIFTLGLKKPCFDIDIESSKNIKRIYDYWLSWTEHDYGDALITKVFQRHIIRVELKRNLYFQDVQDEVIHICNLMMLINLRVLNVNFAWIVFDGQRYPFYFCRSTDSNVDHDGPMRSVINVNNLAAERWKNIFDASYTDKNFKKLWPRFCGMLSYNSYWEFEVLGYMSLLDCYLSSKFNPKNKKGNAYTFYNRYMNLIQNMPHEIKKFIDLSDDDFKVLLKIRNGVAHCIPDNIQTKKDMTYVISRMKKIIILLNYVTLKDLGFNDFEYSEILVKSSNRILLESLPKKKWLTKYIGDAKVITLSNINIQDLKSGPLYIPTPIFVNDPKGEVRYDKVLTEQYEEIRKTNLGKHSKITDYVNEFICTNSYSNFEAEYVKKIHIIIDDSDFIEMNGVIILNSKNILSQKLTAIVNK